MSKKKPRKQSMPARATKRRKVLMSIALGLCLIAAGGAVAQWSGIVSLGQGHTKTSGEVTTQNFTPSSPSKEYIYAGGRLIATEEPAGAPTPPPAPTGLAATPGNMQVSLSWSVSSGASSYNVKRSTTNGGAYSTIALGIGTTSYIDTPLTNGTPYYYVVSASNAAAGEGANSSQASATPTSGGGGTAPTLSNMSPATAIQGASFTLTINGSNLAGATSVNFSPPGDVTITNINSTAGQVTCSVSIGASAATGGRFVTVTTASGGTSTNSLVFGINSSSPAPTISSMSPTKKARGTTFTLTISGTNLSQTTSVNFNPSAGITVSNIVANSTQVTATISISASAATGVRQVSVTTPNGTSNTNSFTVN